MNDEQLERTVSTALHELFPEPTDVTLQVPASTRRAPLGPHPHGPTLNDQPIELIVPTTTAGGPPSSIRGTLRRGRWLAAAALAAAIVGIGVGIANWTGGSDHPIPAAGQRGASSGPAPGRGNVPLTTIPQAGPRVHRVHGQCASPLEDGGSVSGRLPMVGASTVGAVIIWRPGTGGEPCTSVLSHLAAAPAQALARGINSAAPYPTGWYNCGEDTWETIDVYFQQPGVSPSQGEKIVFKVTGCPGVNATGFRSRELKAGLLGNLRATAPVGWSDYLDNGW